MNLRTLLLAICALQPAAAADGTLKDLAQTLANRVADGDGVGVQELMPCNDPGWKKQVEVYATHAAQEGKAGRLRLSVVEVHEEGDVGAALVQVVAANGRRTVPFFAYDRAGWRLVPTPTVAYRSWYDLDAAQGKHLKALEEWARQRLKDMATERSQGAVATWSFGEGHAGEVALAAGAGIKLGQKVETGAKRPARLALNALAESSLILSPGTALTLEEEAQAEGPPHLVIALLQGAVQADINDLGPYAKVRLKGANSDVAVMGTIFLVQRIPPQAGEVQQGEQDYIVQVRGTVKVKRLKGADEWRDLVERQGCAVTATSLGQVETLVNRPQLTSTLIASMDIRAQALSTPQAYAAAGGQAGGTTSWVAPPPAELQAGAGGTAGGGTAGGGTSGSGTGGTAGGGGTAAAGTGGSSGSGGTASGTGGTASGTGGTGAASGTGATALGTGGIGGTAAGTGGSSGGVGISEGVVLTTLPSSGSISSLGGTPVVLSPVLPTANLTTSTNTIPTDVVNQVVTTVQQGTGTVKRQPLAGMPGFPP